VIADLHVHTTFSDGAHTPSAAILEAKRRGLDCIALCDHDTTATTALAVDYGLRAGVATIPGIEISAYDFDSKRKIHLLGYGYRSPANAIEALCTPLRESRDAMTREQIRILREAGYPVSEDAVRRVALGRMNEVERERWPGVLYKQHIMMVLIREGLTTALYGDLYRELFKGRGICAREITYVDVFDALAAIKADGGRAVLAHPGQQDSFDLVERLVAAGLDGIELYHEDHAPAHHRRVLELAHDHGLILTGGSDAHGDHGSIHAIGDIRAPHGAAEALTATGDPDVDWTVDLVRGAREIVLAALLEDRDPARKGGDNRDLVTRYDTAVERHLVEAITARYREDAILAEEQEEPPPDATGALWIIDPIDGTTNFVTAHRDFAISVARYRDGRPEFGVVYDCVTDVVYLGIAGGGARRNGVPLPRRGGAPPWGENNAEGGAPAWGENNAEGGAPARGENNAEGGALLRGENNAEGGAPPWGENNAHGGLPPWGENNAQGGSPPWGENNAQGGAPPWGENNAQGGAPPRGENNAEGGPPAWGENNAQGSRSPISREDAIIEISVSTVDRLRRRAASRGENNAKGGPAPPWGENNAQGGPAPPWGEDNAQGGPAPRRGEKTAQGGGVDPAALTIAHRAQRAYGCASLGLCRVAEGSLDIYLSARISVWDYAAAAIVLAETGGATAVELAEGEGAGAGGTHRGDGGDGAPLVGRLRPDLILHRERRFVVAAADPKLLTATLADYFGDTGRFLVGV